MDKKLNKNDEKHFKVYSLKLINHLCGKGYQIVKIEDNTANPKYKMAIFNNTEELRNDVETYVSTHSKRRTNKTNKEC